MNSTRQWRAPAATGRLDHLPRHAAQPRAQGEEHQRRVLDSQQHDDPLARIDRVGRAERRRDAERVEQCARRPEDLHPAQRRDLGRNHQRDEEAEDERALAPDVGEGDRAGRRRPRAARRRRCRRPPSRGCATWRCHVDRESSTSRRTPVSEVPIGGWSTVSARQPGQASGACRHDRSRSEYAECRVGKG